MLRITQTLFRHLKSQLKELHIIFACDEDHEEEFTDVSIIGFKNNKNLKSHLARTALTDINKVGRWEPCGGKRYPCQLCSNMKNTSTFKSKYSYEASQIDKNFICYSKMVVYLIQPITIKAQIVIFRKNKNCQTKLLTRNILTNITSRVTITVFATGRSL